MKKKDNKIEEPYRPEETPRPPQIIEPNAREERENPDKEKAGEKAAVEKGESKKAKSPALGDEPDIHDETTI
jgi:hypothetical protein